MNVFKTSKKNCILSESIFSAEVHWVIYRIRCENKNFDDMGTLTFRKCILYWVLCEMFDHKAAPMNDRHLGYNNALN